MATHCLTQDRLGMDNRFLSINLYFVADMLFKTNGRICFFEKDKKNQIHGCTTIDVLCPIGTKCCDEDWLIVSYSTLKYNWKGYSLYKNSRGSISIFKMMQNFHNDKRKALEKRQIQYPMWMLHHDAEQTCYYWGQAYND